MKKGFFITVNVFLICFFGISLSALACTDFRVIAQDGTVMICRSLEFAQDLKSNLMTSPRGRQFNTTAPDGKPGLSWKAKFGYVFLDALNMGVAMDGMNDQGLAVEDLYLPGETQYETVPSGQENRALPYTNFADWMLSNFRTVDEVRQALPMIYVFSQKTQQTGNIIFPLHFAVYDPSGKGLVIEFVNGKMYAYDNIGVMTNSPTYNWHITNLRNYVNLSPYNPSPVVANGITYVATGQGAGMVGLPGDVSPPSRFVKIAIMMKSVFQPHNAVEALNVGQHVINNVDIPLGFVREGQNINTATNEYTQWVVFKDLKNKMFYYRTYNDLTLHAVDMNKLDLSENAQPLKMPIASDQVFVDMTQQFIGNKTK